VNPSRVRFSNYLPPQRRSVRMSNFLPHGIASCIIPNYGKAVLPAWANGRRCTPPKSWQTTPGSSCYGRLVV
jgi:hypothetical protein